LHDYACKQWAGLMKDFYKPRWQLFFKQLKESSAKQEPLNRVAVNAEIARFEWSWVNQTVPVYSEQPKGDPVSMSVELYRKYAASFAKFYGRSNQMEN